MLFAYRPLHDRTTWEQLGGLVISVDAHELQKIYAGYLSESQNAYLIDHQGNVISYVDNQGVSYDIPREILPLFSGTFRDRAGGEPQLVSYYTIHTASLQLVVVSDLSVLRLSYQKTALVFLVVLALYVLLALIVTYFLPKRIVGPIRELQANIDLVKEGNLDIEVL